MSEFLDLKREVVGMVSFRGLSWMLMVVRLVAVGGVGDSVSRSHVHGSDVFTGLAAITWNQLQNPTGTLITC